MNGPAPDTPIGELVRRRLLVQESADEYAFRHALTRDAVYATLLRAERRALHEAVGEAIENLYAGRLDAHLEDLAFHFYEADSWARALEYARRAGERAQATFALREAIVYYTRAIAAARRLPRPPGLASLHRARAQAYDTSGEFDRALADHETALSVARAGGDQRAEWQALVDLALLWASRDYQRTGDTMQQALTLARAMGDAAIVGQTLNRLGNWHLNLLESETARRYHDEALQVFRGLNDRGGLAATLDLLGMLECTSGDLLAGADFLRQAVDLWQQIGNRRDVISSLASQALCTFNYQGETLVPTPASLAQALRPPETALASAREMGWRSAEVYALFMMGVCLGARGEYARALACGEAGLYIAQEIDHRQWCTAFHYLLGSTHLYTLDVPEATRYFERGLALADGIGSQLWRETLAGRLVLACVASADLDRARALWEARLSQASQKNHMTGRAARHAQAELALAAGQPAQALALADSLIASAAHIAERGPQAVPHLLWLRGRALAAAGQVQAAVAALEDARQGALALDARPLLWRVRARLGDLYLALERREPARLEHAAARTVVAELAARLPDEARRTNFLRQASAWLPPQE